MTEGPRFDIETIWISEGDVWWLGAALDEFSLEAGSEYIDDKMAEFVKTYGVDNVRKMNISVLQDAVFELFKPPRTEGEVKT